MVYVRNVYLHYIYYKFEPNAGKYSSPMEHMRFKSEHAVNLPGYQATQEVQLSQVASMGGCRIFVVSVGHG